MNLDPNQPSRPDALPRPARQIYCEACSSTQAHTLHPTSEGAAWSCDRCGKLAVSYTHADMRAMLVAYAGPLASAMNLPPHPQLSEAVLEQIEVDVAPKSGGEPITYTGSVLGRHVNATHELPKVGGPFWGHHPDLPPHIAKFELGTVLAVRRVSPETALP